MPICQHRQYQHLSLETRDNFNAQLHAIEVMFVEGTNATMFLLIQEAAAAGEYT